MFVEELGFGTALPLEVFVRALVLALAADFVADGRWDGGAIVGGVGRLCLFWFCANLCLLLFSLFCAFGFLQWI